MASAQLMRPGIGGQKCVDFLRPCHTECSASPSQVLYKYLPLASAFKGARFGSKLCQRWCHPPSCGRPQSVKRHFTCNMAASAEAATESAPAVETGEDTTAVRIRLNGIDYMGLHHVGLLVENIDKALEFYIGTLGLHMNKERPNDKLPYKGAWLWVGAEMIHLMELPNPDPVEGRPEHGGRDRHTCIGVVDIEPVKKVLEDAGIHYTMSKSGRPALFCRDPDGNALEVNQLGPQHEGSSVKHL